MAEDKPAIHSFKYFVEDINNFLLFVGSRQDDIELYAASPTLPSTIAVRGKHAVLQCGCPRFMEVTPLLVTVVIKTNV